MCLVFVSFSRAVKDILPMYGFPIDHIKTLRIFIVVAVIVRTFTSGQRKVRLAGYWKMRGYYKDAEHTFEMSQSMP